LKENEQSSTFLASQRAKNHGLRLLTEIAYQAIPKIPSNLEAKKEIPDSLVIVPKSIGVERPPASAISFSYFPLTDPEP